MAPWRFWSSCSAVPMHGRSARTSPGQKRPRCKNTAFEPLPLGSIRPAGWLKEQLRIQADGLSGHLDEFWPDIKNSAWFGGTAEGWERVPYWLDGLVPLAFETDYPALKSKVKTAIDYILVHQQPDGWLGPVGDSQKHKPYDVWPLFPLFKALVQYQQATGDPRIIPALLDCCRKIDQVISHEPLYSWAKVRAADFALPLYWLYAQTGESRILDLAKKSLAQSQDWRALYENFPFIDKANAKKSLENHGVNTAMALKYGAVRYRLTGDAKDKAAIFPMLDILDRYHGMPTGIFTCDEHLAGRSPSQGTELCTVVEAMYSLEVAVRDHRRRPAGGPPRDAGIQRPARDIQEGHDGPSVRPAVQPGGVHGGGRACLRQQRGRRESLSDSSPILVVARPTCIRVGPSSRATCG